MWKQPQAGERINYMKENPFREVNNWSTDHISRLLWNQKFHNCVTEAHHWTISWARWIQSTSQAKRICNSRTAK